MERVLSWNAQFVLLGNGDREAEQFFGALSARRPDKFKAWLGFDNGLAHRITAGSDFLVMPSRFEPCGLSQMYAMRYGTLPIVRATGGLADTVQRYEEAAGAGTGFVFDDLTADALGNSIGWALSTYHDRPHHIRGMRAAGHGEGLLLGRLGGRVRGPVPRGLPAPPRTRLRRPAARPLEGRVKQARSTAPGGES